MTDVLIHHKRQNDSIITCLISKMSIISITLTHKHIYNCTD